MPLLNEADGVLTGTTSADAVYLGDVQVWPSGSGIAPDELPDLWIWNDAQNASSIVTGGGNGLQWYDSAGSGRRISNGTDPSPTNGRPRYVSSGINGLPSIELRDTGSITAPSGENRPNTAPASVLVVAQYNQWVPAPEVYSYLVAHNTSSKFQLWYRTDTDEFYYRSGSNFSDDWATGISVSLGTPFVIGFTLAGNRRTRLFFDGAFVDEDRSGNDPSNASSGLLRYGRGPGGEPTPCFIGEVVVYDSVLTDEQMIGLSEYMKNKWAIP